MPSLNQCDPNLVARYLADDLSTSEETALELHLDNCASCQQLMTQQGGPEIEWSNALRPNKLDQEVTSDSASSAGPGTAGRLLFSHMLGPTDDPHMLGRVGAFEVSGCVGAGGMGVVFKARDPSLDRCVAVKVLAPHLATSPTARERFAREAKAAAAVVHDNVIAIHQVSQWQGLPYLVMPYLTGPSLQQRLDRDGPMEVDEALRVALQVAEGLAAAHAQGLVHRDVKPANILLCGETERAVLTDFGLARAADDSTLTRVGALAGTPQYMAPEQARGEAVDAGSDLFALGSVIFAMLTGYPPIRCEDGTETIRQIGESPPPKLSDVRPGLPDWLERLVSALQVFDPRERLASAGDAARIVSASLAHVQHPEAKALPTELKSPKPRRQAPIRGVIACALLMLAVGFASLLPRASTFNGKVIEADGTSHADVQAAVDASQDGDIVRVPAGAATWTETLRIDHKGIKLEGMGVERTIITVNHPAGRNQVLLRIEGKEAAPFRVTGFTFRSGDEASDQGLIQLRGDCKSWRLDHCHFESLHGRGIEVHSTDENYGVIDHCEFRANSAAAGVALLGSGNESWQRSLTLGTEKAVYVESCKFTWNVQASGALIAGHGARYVFRHNEVSGTWVGHSGLTARYRAAFSGEIYGNVFADGGVNGWTPIEFSGGTGVIFKNTITGLLDNACVVQNVRSEPLGKRIFGERGLADGSNPLDGNEEPGGYPCCDQVGRSTDSGLGTSQQHSPLYLWANQSEDGSPAPVHVQLGKQHIHANRDYVVSDVAKSDYTPYAFPHPLTKKPSSAAAR